jgi:DNA-binding Lrp family transcriptional regulator
MTADLQDKKQAFLVAIGDVYMRKILMATARRGKSIEEISDEKQIPISTCYRRMNDLSRLGLVTTERIVITASGKKYEIFRSTLKEAILKLTWGELEIELTPIEETNLPLLQALRPTIEEVRLP